MGWKPAPNKRRVSPLVGRPEEQEQDPSGSQSSPQNQPGRRNAVSNLSLPNRRRSFIAHVANVLRHIGDDVEQQAQSAGDNSQTLNSGNVNTSLN